MKANNLTIKFLGSSQRSVCDACILDRCVRSLRGPFYPSESRKNFTSLMSKRASSPWRRRAAKPTGEADRFSGEPGILLRSQIEVGTKPVTTFAAARAELNRLRKMVVDAAHQHSLAPLASGTHPFVQPDETETTDKERYNDLDRDLAGAIRGLAACGMHVHAGIEDEDLRIDLMDSSPLFLAASSYVVHIFTVLARREHRA